MKEVGASLMAFFIGFTLLIAAFYFGVIKRQVPEDINGCHTTIQQLARENYLLSSQVEWLRKNGKR